MSQQTYLTFTKHSPDPTKKTSVWDVLGGGGTKLGEIRWYAPWRRYCYSPAGPQWMDATCLQEVTNFLTTEMARYKARLADEKAEVV